MAGTIPRILFGHNQRLEIAIEFGIVGSECVVVGQVGLLAHLVIQGRLQPADLFYGVPVDQRSLSGEFGLQLIVRNERTRLDNREHIAYAREHTHLKPPVFD